MIVQIDTTELKKLAQQATIAERGTAIYARGCVKKASMAVERAIKQSMPVDTGRARSSWGHWRDRMRKPNPKASESDSFWKSDDGGLSITQGSNVDYVVFLNAGHSTQAPAGFIDKAALLGQLRLEEMLGLTDPLDIETQIRLNNIGMLREDTE